MSDIQCEMEVNHSRTLANNDSKRRINNSVTANSNESIRLMSSSLRYNHVTHYPIAQSVYDDPKRSRTSLLHGNRLLMHQHSHPPLLQQALISNLVNFQENRSSCPHHRSLPLTIVHQGSMPNVTHHKRHSASLHRNNPANVDDHNTTDDCTEVLIRVPFEYRKQHRPIFRAQRSLGNIRSGSAQHGPVQRSSSSSAAEDVRRDNYRFSMELHKRLVLGAEAKCFSPVKWHHYYRDGEYVLNQGELFLEEIENPNIIIQDNTLKCT